MLAAAILYIMYLLYTQYILLPIHKGIRYLLSNYGLSCNDKGHTWPRARELNDWYV